MIVGIAMFFGLIAGVFVAIFCAIACGDIARSKGLNQFSWGLAGLLFGPIAVIVLACIPMSARKLSENNFIEYGAMKTCWHCRSIIPEAAAVCRFCQRDTKSLPTEEPLPKTPVVRTRTDTARQNDRGEWVDR